MTAFALDRLSPRELEALTLLSAGLAPKEAAFAMTLSVSGFYKYVSTAVRKLEARDRFHAVRIVRASLEDTGKSGTGIPGIDDTIICTSENTSAGHNALQDVAAGHEHQFQVTSGVTGLRALMQAMLDGTRPTGMPLLSIALAIVGSATVAGLIVLVGSVLVALLATAASLLGVRLN